MKKMTRSCVRTIGKYGLVIIQKEPTDMDLHVNLKCMNVRIVPTVRYVIYAQKQKKGTIEGFTTMKNGKHKKNMFEQSFQTRKLVKFMENVKLMWNQSSDS